MGKSKAKKSRKPVEHIEKNTKRETVLQSGKKRGKGIFIGISVASLVAAFVAAVLFAGSGGFKEVYAQEGMVRIPVSEVNDGLAHYYTFNSKKPISFFVLRSSDGVIRAAFDACDVCYREKKGYHQEGDLMICNNCGQRFPSVKVNEIKGGCNPAPLERVQQGDYLVLKASDIETGGFYF